ncbi:Mitogen-activated protein kinase kinase kinase ANP1 [Diplonema papillatum]|nr:Mitogen-activated protein kinase kinase kinase ANP1 [Diplonema papillatum]
MSRQPQTKSPPSNNTNKASTTSIDGPQSPKSGLIRSTSAHVASSAAGDLAFVEKGNRHDLSQSYVSRSHRLNSGATFGDASSERGLQYSPSSPSRGHGTPRSQSYLQNIRLGKELGRGGFGRVYQGMDQDCGKFVAVKRIEISIDSSEEQRKQLKNEVDLMQTLRHRNIVQYRGVKVYKTHVDIYMEFVPGGSVQSAYKEFGPLADEVVSSYTRQIIHGLIYLHDANVVHRDIKAANILLHPDGELRLADFGAAVQLQNLQAKRSALGGTFSWLPPEVIAEGAKCQVEWMQDIWSLGCTILEMLTAQPPFRWISDKDLDVIQEIADEDTEVSFPDHLKLSDIAKDFLLTCLQKDPSKRPPARELLNHAYIKLSDSNPVCKDEKEGKSKGETAGSSSSPRSQKKKKPPGLRMSPKFRHSPPTWLHDSPCLQTLSEYPAFDNDDDKDKRSFADGHLRDVIGSPGTQRIAYNNDMGSEIIRLRRCWSIHELDVDRDQDEALGIVLSKDFVVADIASGSVADRAGMAAVRDWLLTTINRVPTHDYEEAMKMFAEQRKLKLTFIIWRLEDEAEILRSSKLWCRCRVTRIDKVLGRLTVSGKETPTTAHPYPQAFSKGVNFLDLDRYVRRVQQPAVVIPLSIDQLEPLDEVRAFLVHNSSRGSMQCEVENVASLARMNKN